MMRILGEDPLAVPTPLGISPCSLRFGKASVRVDQQLVVRLQWFCWALPRKEVEKCAERGSHRLPCWVGAMLPGPSHRRKRFPLEPLGSTRELDALYGRVNRPWNRSQCLTDADVGDDRVALVQQDVLRLDVAVDDIAPVGIVECVGHFGREPHRRLDRQLAFLLQPLAESLPFDHRHHEVQEPGAFSRIVQRQDVWVRELRGQPDFAQESLAA